MKLTSVLTAFPVLAYSLHGAIVISAATVDDRSFDFPPNHVEILDSTGEPVDVGNRILIGSFDTGSDTPSEWFGANQGDLVSIFSGFMPISDDFSLATFGNRDLTFTEPGRFVSTGTRALPQINLPEEKNLFSESSIYIWVLKTDDNGTDVASDFSNVLEYGIYSSTKLDWNFSDGIPTRAVTLRTYDIDQFFVSGGGLSLASVADLVVIPEPSALAMLLGLMAISFMIRRRR